MDGQLPGSIRGLIFDVGDVLYDGSLWRRWLLNLLARMNVHKPYTEFYQEWEHEYYLPACLGSGNNWVALQIYLKDLGLCPGQVDEICLAAQAREKNGLNRPQPFRGVRHTLAYLSNLGISLAALSNTELPEAELRQRLDTMQLGDYFDVVVSSRNCGAIKPQPGAYRAVLDRWQFDPAEVAFVGHDVEELSGAANVGLSTIAVFHEPQVVADWRLDDFPQLCFVTASQSLSRAA